jgi:pyrimidine-nucleoside phosphorylase
MSKKIAAGATGVVLYVKVGKGAFMKTVEDARELAEAMRDIGRDVGLQVRAVLSGMDQPLGWAVGNALEIKEAVETLRGHGPEDLLDVAMTLGSHLLHMAGKCGSVDEGRKILLDVLASGRGLAKFREFIEAQGGDASFIDDPSVLPQAPVQYEVSAPSDGYVATIDAETIGRASVEIGAGRATKGDTIDHSVGFVLQRKIGEKVKRGEPLLMIHAASDASVGAVEASLAAAFTITCEQVVPPASVLEIVQ